MGCFFHGWRKKMGCIALVLACTFTIGWVRSFIAADFVRLPFESDPENFQLSAIATDSGNLVVYWFCGEIEVAGPAPVQPVKPPPMGTHVDLLAISESIQQKLAEVVEGTTTVTIAVPLVVVTKNVTTVPTLVIPFWSIVIPLTLISAWLILSKPRIKPNHTL